jgi:transposase
MKQEKFTIADFNAKYPNEDACLNEIFGNRYGSLKDCPECHKRTNFYRVAGRKCWACQFCSYQLHPLSGTIFHKSETSLKTWFFAIFLFANSKNGVSAMEIMRQTGVTYKTAWRMARQIRKLFEQPKTPLKNTVEIDETFMGGKKEGGYGGSKMRPVIGAVERGSQVRAKAIPVKWTSTVMPFVRQNVDVKATVYTDDWPGYRRRLPKAGYSHSSVRHSRKEYARGIVHTNTIEGFWSQLKRGIDGTYHHVSPYYLQSYVDEFAYRYNSRFSMKPVFSSMISAVAKPS